MKTKRIKLNKYWDEAYPVFVFPTLTFDIYTSIFDEKKLSVDIVFLKFNIGFEILLKK